MTKEVVYLVEHHANRVIPGFANLAAKVAAQGPLESGWVYLSLLNSTKTYSFVNNPKKLTAFTEAINESIDALREGRVEVIPDGQNNKDHVCRACGNLEKGRCRLERRRFPFW